MEEKDDEVLEDRVGVDRVDDNDRDDLDEAVDESLAIVGADSRVQERNANAAIAPTSLWLAFSSLLISNMCIKVFLHPFVVVWE